MSETTPMHAAHPLPHCLSAQLQEHRRKLENIHFRVRFSFKAMSFFLSSSCHRLGRSWTPLTHHGPENVFEGEEPLGKESPTPHGFNSSSHTMGGWHCSPEGMRPPLAVGGKDVKRWAWLFENWLGTANPSSSLC